MISTLLNLANGQALHRPTQKAARGTSIEAFRFDPKKPIHIVGWCEPLTQKEDKVKAKLMDQSSERIKHALKNYLGMLPTDRVKKGDWILMWTFEENGLSRAPNGSVHWMKVDFILTGTTTSKTWRKVCYEGYKRDAHELPFVRDSDVKRAFCKLMRNGTFEQLLSATNAKSWSLQKADGQVKPFLAELKCGCWHRLDTVPVRAGRGA